MCVIAIAEKDIPTPDQVNAFWGSNPHGAGICWREKGKVLWRKGLTLEQAQDAVKHTELPYAIHFRIPSVGPDIPELNHPFPVDEKMSTALEGETDGTVLMHNGSWHMWEKALTETAAMSRVKIPLGKWSDSRAMAFVAGVLGLGWLELMPNSQRVFIFGADGLQDGFGDGWYKLANPEIWVSNKFWEHRMNNQKWQDNRGQVREPFPMGPAQRGNDHRRNADIWDRTVDREEHVDTGIAGKETRLDHSPRVMIPGATQANDPKSPVTGGSPALSPFRTGQEAVCERTDVQQGVEEDRQPVGAEGESRRRHRSDRETAAPGVQAGAAAGAEGGDRPLNQRTTADERWLRGLNPKKYSASAQRYGSGDTPADRYRALCETEASIADRRLRIEEAKKAAHENQTTTI